MALCTIGILLLTLALLLCITGLVSAYFEDNILHCVGLALMVLWMASEARLLIITGFVAARDIWLYSGVLCFGSGTAVRTWLYKRKRNRG